MIEQGQHSGKRPSSVPDGKECQPEEHLCICVLCGVLSRQAKAQAGMVVAEGLYTCYC